MLSSGSEAVARSQAEIFRKSLRFVCRKSKLFVQSKVATVLTAFVWRTKLEQMNVELEHVASSALKKRLFDTK